MLNALGLWISLTISCQRFLQGCLLLSFEVDIIVISGRGKKRVREFVAANDLGGKLSGPNLSIYVV